MFALSNTFFSGPKSNAGYEPVLGSDDGKRGDLEEQPHMEPPIYHNRLKTYSTLTKLLAAACIVLSSILILLVTSPWVLKSQRPNTTSRFPSLHSHQLQSFFLSSTTPWNYSNPSPCGSSPTEARLQGCKWSAATFAWYPSECYDSELENEFLQAENIQHWYATDSLAGGEEYSPAAVLRGDILIAYMPMAYHKLHCVLAGKKLYRALMGEALFDNYVLTKGHLEHCGHFMLWEDHPPVKGEAKYLDCVAM
ncbi:hypothetical protein BP6252_02955 [Coleophoma cylindrospora]|uniref:Uncharacterized protein n=1 Tax=Coleophoma cylindrospora TaxID=1849047 RepID=A0A3D8S6B5_9HELO|nr:hypothetical protein BP6252_02955 [Coleophoma cylindrospora]